MLSTVVYSVYNKLYHIVLNACFEIHAFKPTEMLIRSAKEFMFQLFFFGIIALSPY
jgi:hypothetical protein